MTQLHREKYSAERLRSLYTSLLQDVDAVDNVDDVDPRKPTGTSSRWPRFLPTARTHTHNIETAGDVSDQDVLKTKDEELMVAFRYIACHALPDNCDPYSETDAARRNVSLRALKMARKVEADVVKTLREIGEVVINAERPTEFRTSLRDDDTFAYFCDRAILILLVEIVASQPGGKTTEPKEPLQGVAWSPKIKAQVFHTVSVLVAGVRDTSALYFMLSQNCVNRLILLGLDLLVGGTQWTVDSAAVEEMLSAYTDLLKTLSLHLYGSPELFPLYMLPPNDSESGTPLFPLFSAIVRIITSTYAHSDSYIHATCLNLMVGLMGISNDSVRTWIYHAEREHQLLCHHICQQLIEGYRRIANLVSGPVVDPVRCASIGAQLVAWDDQLAAVDDLFSCHVKVFGLRLCENLLAQVIRLLVRDAIPALNRKFLVVGATDQDVVPSPEASAQAAVLVLARMVAKLRYPPFIRMMAVALFHPRMPRAWESRNAIEDSTRETEFVWMSLLNKLVLQPATSDDNSSTPTNAFRKELLKSLSCDYGEWRFLSAAAVVEQCLQYVDMETLAQLDFLPAVCEKHVCTVAGIERALATYLARKHSYRSSVSLVALEYALSLSLQYTNVSTQHIGGDFRRLQAYKQASPILRHLYSMKSVMIEEVLESQSSFPATDIVVDVVEMVVKTRYKRRPVAEGHRPSFAFLLSPQLTKMFALGPEALIRKRRGVEVNEVETIRFYVQMAIHCRAVCRVVDRWYSSVLNPTTVEGRVSKSKAQGMDWDDEASELQTIFSSLADKPIVGTDLDFQGRTAFRLAFPVNPFESNQTRHNEVNHQGHIRTVSNGVIVRESPDFMLVLDPTDLWIVQLYPRTENSKRGTIVCGVPLLDIVAAATDESRLHVAVHHHDDVGCLIQNGNMVLMFESSGTSLIVCRYLEKCRAFLRHDLHRQHVQFFQAELATGHEITQITLP